MTTRYQVSLNNNQLDAVDSRIVVTDIQYPEPQIVPTLDARGGTDGAVVSRWFRQKASVTVSFIINAYGIADRNEVLQKIIKWAMAGGVLRTNDRTGQRLSHAVADQLPAMRAKHWTEELTLTFSDYAFPYWENDTEITLSLAAGTDQSGSITVDGNARQTYLTGAITAKASVTWIKIITSMSTVYLTGLNLSNGDVVNIGYDSGMNLTIMNGTTSLLDKRTGDSADELLIPIGTNMVMVQASGNVESSIKARGCWI